MGDMQTVIDQATQSGGFTLVRLLQHSGQVFIDFQLHDLKAGFSVRGHRVFNECVKFHDGYDLIDELWCGSELTEFVT